MTTATPTRPATLNGFPVINAQRTPAASMTRAGWVVLVKRDGDTPHPYVTAWAGEGDSSWCWGHYFGAYPEAIADFAGRCARGY